LAVCVLTAAKVKTSEVKETVIDRMSCVCLIAARSSAEFGLGHAKRRRALAADVAHGPAALYSGSRRVRKVLVGDRVRARGGVRDALRQLGSVIKDGWSGLGPPRVLLCIGSPIIQNTPVLLRELDSRL